VYRKAEAPEGQYGTLGKHKIVLAILQKKQETEQRRKENKMAALS